MKSIYMQIKYPSPITVICLNVVKQCFEVTTLITINSEVAELGGGGGRHRCWKWRGPVVANAKSAAFDSLGKFFLRGQIAAMRPYNNFS